MHFDIIEILYFIFIFPLQFSLNVVLDCIFNLIKSQGLSIVFLSLLLNIFLLKIFSITDLKARKIGRLKASCDSKINEFKRVFKGAELQSYIRTLYKQRHYHPIFALSSLGGLALQVPFFIAVFCLLQEIKWLQNASFLWIGDLSKPDSAIFGFHLLPILMTIITLINVFITSKEKGARLQGSLIALIFLVLLYNMPSALVLYWTTNMLFSLGRTLFKVFRGDSSDSVESNADSSRQGGDSLPKRLYEALIHTCKSIKSSNKIVSHEVVLTSRNDKVGDSSDFADSSDSSLYRTIAKLVIVAIGILIFIFNPILLYTSDINQFDADKIFVTFGGLVGFFALFCVVMIYMMSFIRVNKIIALLLCVIFTLCVIYSFILVGNYGAMDNFILQNLTFKEPTLRFQKYLNAIVALCISGALALLLLRRFGVICKIAIATMLLITSANAYKIFSQISLKNVSISHNSMRQDSIQIPPPITFICQIKTSFFHTAKMAKTSLYWC